jgi:hypothetical protein
MQKFEDKASQVEIQEIALVLRLPVYSFLSQAVYILSCL